MIFVLETMVNKNNVEYMLSLVGFDHFNYVVPTNHSKRLAVVWNSSNISALILRKKPRAIQMLMYNAKNLQNSIISKVFALAQSRHKDCFWSHLLEVNRVIDLEWCIIGDLKEIVKLNEKTRGIGLT